MDNNIIFKTHQHKIDLIFRTLKIWIVPTFLISIIIFIASNIIFTILGFIAIFSLFYSYFYFFYSKSYFYITNDKLSINVRNWIFSQYNMSIYFDQIKDMAYSKNHFLHYMFDYWVLFVRSSAWSDWNFIVQDIPNIEEVYKKVSYLYTLSNEERQKINNLENTNIVKEKPKTKEKAIEENKNILLNITWIKEVEILTNEDKKFIFEHEEDRNHGVYECIKRQVTLVFTHDAKFRNADAPIVLKLWNKVIFPPVSFHEIKEKNVVSSSPWMEVHNYLSKKFKNLWEYDATVLVGFDL